MNQDDIVQLIRQEISRSQTEAQYNVSKVPWHVHNNLDAPQVSFRGLADVPHSYTGNTGKVVTVNTSETGLVFTNGGGAASITVKDGITTVNGVSTVKFTSGATVTNAGAGEADIAVTGSGLPAGLNTQVQYNDNGAFGADSGLTYDKNNAILYVDTITASDDAALELDAGADASHTQGRYVTIKGGDAFSGIGGKVQLNGGAGGGAFQGGNVEITGGTGTIGGKILLQSGYTSASASYTPAGGATATLDLAVANEHRITMPAGNITIALSNPEGSQKFIISITQDSGGSRLVTWFNTIRWAGGSVPTLTTTPSKRDTFGFIRTGSGTYDGFVVGQNI